MFKSIDNQDPAARLRYSVNGRKERFISLFLSAQLCDQARIQAGDRIMVELDQATGEGRLTVNDTAGWKLMKASGCKQTLILRIRWMPNTSLPETKLPINLEITRFDREARGIFFALPGGAK